MWPAQRERILIVGADALAVDLLRELSSHPRPRHVVVGVVAGRGEKTPAGLESLVVGAMDQLTSIAEGLCPDRILVALTRQRGLLPARQLLDLRMRGMVVEESGEFYERLTGKIPLEHLTPGRLAVSPGYRVSAGHALVSRALSLATAAVALPALAPVFVLIALAIRRESPGPIFFIQERLGLGGRPFRLVKFRTMLPASEHTSEWAGSNSHRITRLGRWLRRFHLDELPQLLNVLAGDMNLVGPRPHPVSNFEMFVTVARNTPACGAEIPYYSMRSLVRPGITGWAQVRYGYADDLEQEIEKLRYDLYYIKHLSVWLDLRILLRTVRIVLRGRERIAAGVPSPRATVADGGRPSAASTPVSAISPRF